MVLLEGIELSTSPLPRGCSTTELQQRRCGQGRGIAPSRRTVQGAGADADATLGHGHDLGLPGRRAISTGSTDACRPGMLLANAHPAKWQHASADSRGSDDGRRRVRLMEGLMDKAPPPRPKPAKLTARQEREAAALRANLRKRKDQARAREKPKQE